MHFQFTCLSDAIPSKWTPLEGTALAFPGTGSSVAFPSQASQGTLFCRSAMWASLRSLTTKAGYWSLISCPAPIPIKSYWAACSPICVISLSCKTLLKEDGSHRLWSKVALAPPEFDTWAFAFGAAPGGKSTVWQHMLSDIRNSHRCHNLRLAKGESPKVMHSLTKKKWLGLFTLRLRMGTCNQNKRLIPRKMHWKEHFDLSLA